MSRKSWRASYFAAGVMSFLIASFPAQAGDFDITRDTGFGGSGQSKGTVTWGSASQFSDLGDSRDICPADGHGISYYFLIEVPGYGTRISKYTAVDSDGCGNGWAYPFGGDGETINAATGRKFSRARVYMCFTDDGDPCWMVHVEPGVWKNNPYYP